MSLLKVATYLVNKYKFGQDSSRLESSVRNSIHMLWRYANDPKLFNILSVCAESNPKKPTTPDEVKAREGAKFCKQLITMINYLQANQETIDLGTMQQVLKEMVQLIAANKDLAFSEKGRISDKGTPENVQFPHVSELIFQIIPISSRYDRTQRNQLFNKAKTGLSRILSLSLTILKDLSKLELIAPDKFIKTTDESGSLPDRFSPQRTALSDYDIIDFIRQHGEEYGLSSTEDWEVVFRDDPDLKENMTTIINAVNRGRYSHGSPDMKMEIARILRDHEMRRSTNEKALEGQPEFADED